MRTASQAKTYLNRSHSTNPACAFLLRADRAGYALAVSYACVGVGEFPMPFWNSIFSVGLPPLSLRLCDALDRLLSSSL